MLQTRPPPQPAWTRRAAVPWAGLPCQPSTAVRHAAPCLQDRLVCEAGATAILSLQSDLCLEALKVDLPAVRRQAVRQGVLHCRCAVRDFDHNDQAAMLPEAVRMVRAGAGCACVCVGGGT